MQTHAICSENNVTFRTLDIFMVIFHNTKVLLVKESVKIYRLDLPPNFIPTNYLQTNKNSLGFHSRSIFCTRNHVIKSTH